MSLMSSAIIFAGTIVLAIVTEVAIRIIAPSLRRAEISGTKSMTLKSRGGETLVVDLDDSLSQQERVEATERLDQFINEAYQQQHAI